MVRFQPVRPAICGLCLTLAITVSALAQTKEAPIVDAATNVLNEFMAIPNQGIPRSFISKAEGLVIVPGMLKAGFIAGVRRGKGVVVIRDEQGVWKPPAFVTMTGGSVGWQVGVQATDVILVLRTRKSIAGIMSGKFTIGADAAAAAGPVGRQAAAATDGKLQAEILSYSRSRGLFIGVSVDGSVLQIDAAANQAYYRSAGMMADGTPYAAGAQLPPSASRLLAQLASYGSAPGTAAGHSTLPARPDANQPSPAMSGSAAAPAGTTLAPNGLPTDPTTPPSQDAGSGARRGGIVGTASAGQPPAAGQAAATSDPSETSGRGATESERLNATRQQLVAATQQLGPLLDEPWRRYFSLPTEVFQTEKHPSVTSLEQPITRFERVAGDPQYQLLIDRQEFQRVRDWLRIYRDQLQALAVPTAPPPSSLPLGDAR